MTGGGSREGEEEGQSSGASAESWARCGLDTPGEANDHALAPCPERREPVVKLDRGRRSAHLHLVAVANAVNCLLRQPLNTGSVARQKQMECHEICSVGSGGMRHTIRTCARLVSVRNSALRAQGILRFP